jgi:aromatic-L-amino-acid decarboxylase
METSEFRRHGHALVDWMADYMEQIEQYPVRSRLEPGEILAQLPASPPESGEPFEEILEDFRRIILPGMTHWQHPSFFAYFNANASPPSILAEMLTATLGAQCMSWATSPAATELEERMMQWFASMVGFPPAFAGVIQDTASTSTLCSILTAREVATGHSINRRGFSSGERLTAYCSSEAHSSIEKGLKIAGFGSEQLRKIPVDERFALVPEALERAITTDRASGFTPCLVVAALGTTGSTAIDPLRPITAITRRHSVWLHVDAAYAGAALVLPELRWMSDGIELADSVVINPHKWLMTNFDCSAYFVRDPAALVRTMTILPDYLKTTETSPVNNYRDWGIALGRRFRALKLWFVFRHYGRAGLQQKIRHDIALAQELASSISAQTDFELLAPVPLNVLCFRYHPPDVTDIEVLNRMNACLLEALNQTGRLFLSHTTLNGAYVLRLCIGQTNVTRRHATEAWALIQEKARALPLQTR